MGKSKKNKGRVVEVMPVNILKMTGFSVYQILVYSLIARLILALPLSTQAFSMFMRNAI